MSKKLVKIRKKDLVQEYESDVLCLSNLKLILAYLLDRNQSNPKRVKNLYKIFKNIGIENTFPNNQLMSAQANNPVTYGVSVKHVLKYLVKISPGAEISSAINFMRRKIGQEVYDIGMSAWIENDMPKGSGAMVDKVIVELTRERFTMIKKQYDKAIEDRGFSEDISTIMKYYNTLKEECDELCKSDSGLSRVIMTDPKSLARYREDLKDKAKNSIVYKFEQRQLNQMFLGGLAPGELTVIISPTGGGKSMTSSNLFASAYKKASNPDSKLCKKIIEGEHRPVFLYVTLENSLDMDIARIIKAIMPNRDDIDYKNKLDFCDKIGEFTDYVTHRVGPVLEIVKAHADTTVDDIETLIKDIESRVDYSTGRPLKVVLLFADYLGVMDTNSEYDAKRHQLGRITVDFKKCADKRNLSVVTCVQMNKTTATIMKECTKNRKDIRDANISEYDASESSEIAHAASRVLVVQHGVLAPECGEISTVFYLPKSRDGKTVDALYVKIGDNGIGWISDDKRNKINACESYAHVPYLVSITKNEDVMKEFVTWLKFKYGSNPKYGTIKDVKRLLIGDELIMTNAYDSENTPTRAFALYDMFITDLEFRTQYKNGSVKQYTNKDTNQVVSNDLNNGAITRLSVFDRNIEQQSPLNRSGFNI